MHLDPDLSDEPAALRKPRENDEPAGNERARGGPPIPGPTQASCGGIPAFQVYTYILLLRVVDTKDTACRTVKCREVVVHELLMEVPDGCGRFAEGQLAGGRARVA